MARKEIWKDVDLTQYGGKNYTGYYQISNTAKVKGLKRLIRQGKRLIILKEKILKPSFRRYLSITLCKNSKLDYKSIHRLVAIAFIPNPLHLPEVNHKDGIKSNCNDWNLEWTTRSDNQKHSVLIGLRKVNEQHHNSKFKNKDVIFILKNRNKYSIKEYSEMFKVSLSAINNILYNKKSWTKLKKDLIYVC